MSENVSTEKQPTQVSAPVSRMQGVIQRMLHYDLGVPVRSHTRRLVSTVPSAFIGADVVMWLMKNLAIQSKAEAIHFANLLSRHGFFFCVEGTDTPVKDDSTLFRFQTPHYWPSQNPPDSDYDYAVYLVKQVLWSKHRIRLHDYELNNLHKVKLRLAKDWKAITNKAEMDVKIFREQRGVSKAIISSQEEAFWRLRRPPPGSSSVSDSTLTRHYLARPEWRVPEWSVESLKVEVAFLKAASERPKVHISTVLEGLTGYCRKYQEFDPMLESPLPSNPWTSGDTTLWTIETSILQTPTARHVRMWACSFQTLLSDVTGRQVFENYCRSQYNLENVRFWQACRDLKSIPLKAIPSSVRLIYDEFLQRYSRSEVIVSANAQEEAERDLNTPSRYAFTAAQEQIYHLMQNDIYSHFLKSTLYQDMLKHGKEAIAGRGFFARLQPKKKLDVGLKDASEISPNLPQWYTRKQVNVDSTTDVAPDKMLPATQEKIALTVEEETIKILENPQDTSSKPGEKVELSITTDPVATSYKWCFKELEISADDQQYEGSATNHLIIKKCLPKHKGAYNCMVTDESGKLYFSRAALLQIDGEQIESEELTLLGDILSRTNVDFTTSYGVDIQQLDQSLTYEEMQFVLSEDPATEFLSQNLKDKLESRLKEEKLYKEAIQDDHSVSLSYVKILALGPGQVGKSTFLYRLMGLMEGNIQTAEPKTQPQSSTGVTEQREACIRYASLSGALTSAKKWQVFEESSELKTQLGGLMSLISEQIQQPLINPKSSEVTVSHIFEDVIPTSEAKSMTETITESVKQSLPDLLPIIDDFKLPEVTTVEQFVESQSEFEEEQDSQPDFSQQTSVASMLSQSEIDTVIGEFECILDECKINKTQIKLDMLLNIADIGGQPAFLEMLPSLTIGPALYLVFMNLLKGLETRYPVVFKCKDNREQVLCQNYTYTSEEVIFTALSSIASFGNSDEEVEMYVLKEDFQQQTTSLALLVGTFADKVSDEEVVALHAQIKQQVKETDYYTKKNLLYDTKFLEVDNLSAKDDEIMMQRSLIEGLLRDKFRKYQIPARWLMLSICLKLVAKKLNTFELSFSDCVEIGHHFEMTEEAVRAALKFLHKYIGLVMYFPNHPHLKDVVICDPQVVFSSVSELIFDIYDPSKKYVPEAKYDHFVETGCFSPQDITPKGSKQMSSKQENLLSIETIVELLVHLNIAAEVPLSSDEASLQSDDSVSIIESPNPRKEYFLPAVLQTADTSLLRLGCIEENDELAPEPLCIRFITGYVPLGFVCALSANLMANNQLLQLIPFKQGSQSITYKNMMKFRYSGVVDIIMVSGPKYCEFQIRRWSKTAEIEFWDSNCCPHIKDIICEATKRVVQSMQHGDSVYKLSNCFELAFKCPAKEHMHAEFGHEPLAKFTYEATSSELSEKEPSMIQCVSSKCVTSSPLTPAMKMWFGKDVPAIPLEIISHPAIEDNVIRLKAEGTKPIKYQWFKDEVKLSDDNDYKGSTTPELFIRNLHPHLKGTYCCQVQDKYQQCRCSNEAKFDPFVIELKREDLRDKEIFTLIENEFTSMKDLKENLEPEDLEELGLKLGEKRRLKKFLNKLHTQDTQVESVTETGLNFNWLKDIFWEVRAKWYLLGIQLDVEYSDLEVARRKAEVYEKYMSILKSFLDRKNTLPSCVDVKLALKSVLFGFHDFDLPHEVQEELKQQSCDGVSGSDDKPISKATRLRKVLTALWEVRAQWRRLAGEMDKITEGDCEAIKSDFSSVDEYFAALIHKCLSVYKDSAHQVLLKALRSKAVGRDDVADEFERQTLY